MKRNVLLVVSSLIIFSRIELPAADLIAPARQSLSRATDFLTGISTQGGYLWSYSLDLKSSAGEKSATPTQVWVQPPGTPSVGHAFLQAWRATKEEKHLEAARRAAECLVAGQLESGGWDYLIEFDPQKRSAWKYRIDSDKRSPAKQNNLSTYDDDNTQSAVRFLLEFQNETRGSANLRDAAIREALDYSLEKLLQAQYPNGAWPQRWDGKPHDPKEFPVLSAAYPAEYPRQHPQINYYNLYTLNDGTLSDLIAVMLEAWHSLDNENYLAAAKKGGDFLLLAQLPEPQPAWAQQYNSRMEPAWARAFEPPAIASGESVGAMRALIHLHIETGDEKYLKPIFPALAWMKRSSISPDLWARYYELPTNQPIFGDRDGKIYFRLEDISEERRNGYAWHGNFGFRDLQRTLDKLQVDGRDKILRSLHRKNISENEKTSRLASLPPKVREIIAAQDAEGRWLSQGVKKFEWTKEDHFSSELYIRNIALLTRYLEAAH